MPHPVLRFAPSPNGPLHLGHAYSALFTWRAALRLGGTVLLRIEDIDPVRSKPEFAAAIIDDLGWLGRDIVTAAAYKFASVSAQSMRFPAYRAAISQLGDLLYPCTCSRAEIAARASATDPDGAPLYDGHCRRHPPVDAGRAQWRLKLEEAVTTAGILTIEELPVAGIDIDPAHPAPRIADPARWGDAVIVRKDVPASYHLSVVVDDAAQEVTHVTRGMDLYAATDLHVLLQRLLGLPSPLYAHHRLIEDDTGAKLSKSKGSASLRSLREAGWTAAEVRQRLRFG